MRILSCVFVIIGVIIGAGFASGAEIYNFFFIYGKIGIVGLIISAIIIGYTIYKTLKIINKYNINSYDKFIDKIIKNKQIKYIDISLILNVIIKAFLIITFFIMCAGFTAYFKQEFGINAIYSSISIAIISYIILNQNIKGIIKLNSILIPLIITILFILGIKGYSSIGSFMENQQNNMWFPNAILYSSYNCITLTSVLIPMKKYINTNKDILKIALLVTMIIIILASVIIVLLLNIDIDISQIELPAVYASRTFWRIIQIFIWDNNNRSNNNNSNIFSIWILEQCNKR